MAGPPAGAKPSKYPRSADVNAANAKIVIGGKTVGRWDNWQVVTDAGNGRAGGDMRLAVQALVTIGGDTIALGSAAVTSDAGGIVGPIIGGTGRYAGAEGTASSKVTENSRTRFVQHLTLTFVP